MEAPRQENVAEQLLPEGGAPLLHHVPRPALPLRAEGPEPECLEQGPRHQPLVVLPDLPHPHLPVHPEQGPRPEARAEGAPRVQPREGLDVDAHAAVPDGPGLPRPEGPPLEGLGHLAGEPGLERVQHRRVQAVPVPHLEALPQERAVDAAEPLQCHLHPPLAQRVRQDPLLQDAALRGEPVPLAQPAPQVAVGAPPLHGRPEPGEHGGEVPPGAPPEHPAGEALHEPPFPRPVPPPLEDQGRQLPLRPPLDHCDAPRHVVGLPPLQVPRRRQLGGDGPLLPRQGGPGLGDVPCRRGPGLPHLAGRPALQVLRLLPERLEVRLDDASRFDLLLHELRPLAHDHGRELVHALLVGRLGGAGHRRPLQRGRVAVRPNPLHPDGELEARQPAVAELQLELGPRAPRLAVHELPLLPRPELLAVEPQLLRAPPPHLQQPLVGIPRPEADPLPAAHDLQVGPGGPDEVEVPRVGREREARDPRLLLRLALVHQVRQVPLHERHHVPGPQPGLRVRRRPEDLGATRDRGPRRRRAGQGAGRPVGGLFDGAEVVQGQAAAAVAGVGPHAGHGGRAGPLRRGGRRPGGPGGRALHDLGLGPGVSASAARPARRGGAHHDLQRGRREGHRGPAARVLPGRGGALRGCCPPRAPFYPVIGHGPGGGPPRAPAATILTRTLTWSPREVLGATPQINGLIYARARAFVLACQFGPSIAAAGVTPAPPADAPPQGLGGRPETR